MREIARAARAGEVVRVVALARMLVHAGVCPCCGSCKRYGSGGEEGARVGGYRRSIQVLGKDKVSLGALDYIYVCVCVA